MPEGREELSGLLPQTEGVSDGAAEAHQDDSPADESPRQTVERIFQEAQKEDDGEDSGTEQEAPETALEQVRPPKDQQQQAQNQPQDGFKIPPPARLNAAQKEAFHALPEPLKRAAHQMFKDHEAQFTRASQKLHADLSEVTSIKEAVRPYFVSHPELAAAGYTESKFIGGLVAAHQMLTDPKTAKRAWLELGPQVGIDPGVLEALQEHIGAAPQNNPMADPQIRALQEQVQQLSSRLEGQDAQRFEQTVSSITAEMAAVRDEMDESGRYLYPELHDEAFIHAAKPLVSALVGSIPGLSYGEALKRAHATMTGRYGNSGQANQARFPQQQNNTLERAQQAAVSVRGRSAPSSAAGNTSDIPPEALKNPQASVRWALEQLRRGN